MLEIIGSILLVTIGLAVIFSVVRYEIQDNKKIRAQKTFF